MILPTRVMISEHEAISAMRAKREHGIELDNIEIVFVRGDGWTLGTPKQFEKEAFDMWAGHWVQFMRCSTGNVVFPISEYNL